MHTFEFIRPTDSAAAIAAAAIAVVESVGRMNSKVCIVPSCCLSAFSNLLDRFDDIGVGAATTDVATHQFLYCRIVGTTRLFEQRNG